ncbi:hypothetical protein GQ55_9G175400 [Panicum hallii var. hallii]|uniref:Uncharacterized protein n=1 Tax=Panicum hallii var. hallii TaxID=1504633 RepID=A0A2T7C4C0_9POAL|nr:hypothetical protein GQ55_9G175400 [Panicum hallii var. hallii]
MHETMSAHAPRRKISETGVGDDSSFLPPISRSAAPASVPPPQRHARPKRPPWPSFGVARATGCSPAPAPAEQLASSAWPAPALPARPDAVLMRHRLRSSPRRPAGHGPAPRTAAPAPAQLLCNPRAARLEASIRALAACCCRAVGLL